jgi:uncharacterized protein YecT (DUF1311 family)
MVRRIVLGLAAGVAAGVISVGNGAADPLLECGVVTANQIELRQCLQRQLDISDRAMTEALALARTAAQELERVTGRNLPVLAIEASQHAWEAYRDAECRTHGAFAAGGSGEGSFVLACSIELTRERTDGLLRLANRRRG